ncbi:uncharacterized protein C8Q71DRAFT_811995 [Rhodofomes roseus]|uniref:Fungal-type protein kinase domain-containing protein n=1 Tax=Rhodofomes roseus TaxID=34475 RepID=A0ABQ8KCY8_9APHY|nr:uncharacterized protein C8Q71DRAFT_811995 [Rhodofomes roseus]KAH9835356.1 hypothetical protein C8Q71DRAFT_811995 [Rhodofomes roseus]
MEYPINSPAQELELYAPFVALVQSITNYTSRMAGAQMNGVRWRDYHSIMPLSRDPGAPEIRPDIIATIGVANNESVPWSRILVPVEVKKQKREGPALLQLLKYMHMVFHEAVDRCFVFGIIIACANMSVYLADRTGVLGSSVFNIHKEPRLFIRVIAGICTSSLANLGWDTSMTDYYWVIDMPKPKEGAEYGVMDEKDTEKFVLYKAFNVQRGEVIRGRATRIWKAWLFDELTLSPEDRQLFIMKDTWRDDERRLEGEFYKHIGRHDGVATMRSYGVVSVDDKEDKVVTRIRRDLQVCAKPRCINISQKDILLETIPLSTPDRTRDNTTDYGILIDYLPRIEVPERSPRGRTHSRLIMGSYGWPIKYALSLLEMVQAMHDALAGHWAAYEKGVTHRDLSDTNILITGSKEVGRRGMVIDFDYAKILGDATLAEDPISGTRPFMSGEILTGQRYSLSANAELSDDDQHDDANNVRPVHTFYHDLESLFWILLWICICRAGPALRRLDGWEADDGVAGDQYKRYFKAPGLKQLGYNKYDLFALPKYFGDCLSAVTTYHRPLVPLLRSLRKILRNGYGGHFNEVEAYRAFLQAFKDTEQSLSDQDEELNEDQQRAFQAEERRREVDLMDWERTPRKMARQEAAPDVGKVGNQSAAEQRTGRVNEAEPADTDSDGREESPTPLPPPTATTSRAERKLIQDAMASGPSTRASQALPPTGVSMQSMSRVSVAPTASEAQSPPPSETSQTSAPVQTKSKKRGREGADDASVAGEGSEQGGGAKRAKRGSGGRGRGSARGSGNGRGRGGGGGGSRSQPDRKGKGRAVDPS